MEWFEENPYTRELKGAVDLDFNECGCKDGEERWVDRATRKEVWYVEIKNDAAPNTLCDVSFLPTAVDICQGHGTWRSNGEGCVCDNGYDGQYQGPVESLSTQKKNNRDANGVPPKGSAKHDVDVILQGIRKKLDNRGKNAPIEPAPGEVGGSLGTQDAHNLGCGVTAPVFDQSLVKRVELGKARAAVSMARSGNDSDRPGIEKPPVGNVYDYGHNRTAFFLRKRQVDEARTPSDKLYKDDCSGMMTANTMKQMSDDLIIACTGRTRAEMVQGLEGSTPALNKVANKLIQERSTFSSEEKHSDGWGTLKDPRDTVGREANRRYVRIVKERDEDLKNRGPPYGSKEEQKAKREKKEKADTTVENRELEVDDSQKIVHDDNEQNHERQFRDENMFKLEDAQ